MLHANAKYSQFQSKRIYKGFKKRLKAEFSEQGLYIMLKGDVLLSNFYVFII